MRIALTYTGDAAKHDNYVRWLKASTDIDIGRLSVEQDNLQELTTCDALVLSGGVDIYPPVYKGMSFDYPHVPKDGFRKNRDEFEIRAFKQAQDMKLPVLGVCRGLQLINCIYGGNLVQDLGENGNIIHKFETNDKAHGVKVQTGTLLYDICQVPRTVVNSAHHQAVNEMGQGLKVNCVADDGTIEGLERENKGGLPFLLCIQWHPERMYKFHLEDSPLSKAIRDRFIEEIKKSVLAK
jgi:putative glutamine amidotransferase